MKKITKKWSLFIIATFVTFFGIGYTLINRGTYSVDEVVDTDSLIIECPDEVLANTSVTCTITLNSVSINVQKISTKFNVTDGLELVSFASNGELWDENPEYENGFSLDAKNTEGLSGRNIIGTVEFKMPNVEPESVYKVELMEATIIGVDDTTINLDNAFDEIKIRALSDVNTLDDITVNDSSLNESFDKNVNNYSVNVDSDKIAIEFTKTDEKSTVTITEGYENIHYGTNTISITVVSESGKENVYNINVFRTYNLNTDKYIYNKDKNYLYTGTDVDNATILSNISIPSELDKNININQLIISYKTEEILKIDILNISCDNYNITDDTISVDAVTYNDFIINLNSNNDEITYKVFDSSEEDTVEVTSGDILTGMELKIYYNGDVLVTTYKIVVEGKDVYELVFSDDLNVDLNDKFIKYLTIGSSVGQLLDKVTITGGIVVVRSIDGDEKDNDSLLKTGDILIVYEGDVIKEEYTLSILGDANGDGKLGLVDLGMIRKQLVGNIELENDVNYYALDVNKDGKLGIVDLGMIRKMIVGLI